MANLRGQGAPSTLKASAGSTYTDTSSQTVYTNVGTFGIPNWKVTQMAPTRVSLGAISGGTATALSSSTESAVFVITGATLASGAVASYTWVNSLISTDSIILGTVGYVGAGAPFYLNSSNSGGTATVRIANFSGTTSGNINLGLRII